MDQFLLEKFSIEKSLPTLAKDLQDNPKLLREIAETLLKVREGLERLNQKRDQEVFSGIPIISSPNPVEETNRLVADLDRDEAEKRADIGTKLFQIAQLLTNPKTEIQVMHYSAGQSSALGDELSPAHDRIVITDAKDLNGEARALLEAFKIIAEGHLISSGTNRLGNPFISIRSAEGPCDAQQAQALLKKAELYQNRNKLLERIAKATIPNQSEFKFIPYKEGQSTIAHFRLSHDRIILPALSDSPLVMKHIITTMKDILGTDINLEYGVNSQGQHFISLRDQNGALSIEQLKALAIKAESHGKGPRRFSSDSSLNL